jgi:hypothetical protein
MLQIALNHALNEPHSVVHMVNIAKVRIRMNVIVIYLSQ